MKQFVIQKNANVKKAGRKKIVIEGYEMKPKLKKHDSLVSVSEVTVVSPKLHELALKKQFKTAYRKVFKKVMIVLEDNDASQTDTVLALDEVAKMKAILKEKYKQNVSKQEYRNMWKKVSLLQTELQKKQALLKSIEDIIKQYAYVAEENERGKSR